MDRTRVVLFSPYWEEDLVAELYYDDVLWGVLKWRGDDLLPEIVTDSAEAVFTLPLADALKTLDIAKKRIAKP